jgi:hypothetical protein
VFFDGAAPAPPSSLAVAVRRSDNRHWELEWPGPLGGVLDALQGLPVSDIEIEPFRLEDYVLRIYSDESRAAT